MAFTPLVNNNPFIKIGIMGFAGDGKTTTAAMIAIGIHKKIKSKKPIAFYDTEKSARLLLPLFQKEKIEVQTDENRSLIALKQDIDWCVAGGSDILIIDSMTHIWTTFVNTYKKQKNKSMLTMYDWGILKTMWYYQFSEQFVNANIHIVFTGRSGYEYENEEVQGEDGKVRKEINKTGVKMKVEGETAYEPDIFVFMEKIQDILSSKKKIYRIATVLKDRTRTIDGLVLNQDGKKKGPDFNDFLPAINVALANGVEKTAHEKIVDNFDSAETKQHFQKVEREKLISDVEGVFSLMDLGTGAKDKQFKTYLLKNVYAVLSIERLSELSNETLLKGVKLLEHFASDYSAYVKNCAEGNVQVDPNRVDEIFKEIQLQHTQNKEANELPFDK